MINKRELRISRKERRIILRYLRFHNDFDTKHPLPADYKCLKGITFIDYGYMGLKRISTTKIEFIAKQIGAKSW